MGGIADTDELAKKPWMAFCNNRIVAQTSGRANGKSGRTSTFIEAEVYIGSKSAGTPSIFQTLSMDAWQMGGDYWGPVDIKAAEETAICTDKGNYDFDTAYCYGAGKSEEITGESVSGTFAERIIS